MSSILKIPPAYLLRRFGTTLDLGLLQLTVTPSSPLKTGSMLFDSFNPDKEKFMIAPYECEGYTTFTATKMATYVDIINEYYEKTTLVKGMGENDLGVTFAGTIGDPLYDEESRSLMKEIVQGVKDGSRHGVPFYVRSSGLTLDVSDVQNGLLDRANLGCKGVEVFLFGGSPPAYTAKTGTDAASFGRVCSVVSTAAEQGVNVSVGIAKGDREAGALALALGATSVSEYPGGDGGVSTATGC